MFDTVTGLPVHALVVHAVVVLLPLMSVVTVLTAVLRSWRPKALWVAAADAAVFVASFAARESGESLQSRLQRLGNPAVAADHGRYGGLLPLFALFLVAAALGVHLAARRAQLMPVAIAVTVVAALAATGWTVLVGDSGARAVWADTIKNTTAP
jgi:hypothetical protein